MDLAYWCNRWLKGRMGEQPLPVRLRLWNGQQIDLADEPRVTFTLHRPGVLPLLWRPSLGALAQAYIDGDLDVDGDLAEVVQVAVALTAQRQKSWPGFNWPGRHSRRTDMAAVQYHYDVSNEFYGLWLDRQMVYSCAYFAQGDEDLDQAQAQKLDYICRKLLLRPGERFLDIGCGWGGLIRWAAQHYGVTATGITVSQQQYDYARERIAAEGLEARCQVHLCDYRDLPADARFDKVASIGMFEHVGQRRYAAYFGIIRRLLNEGGLVLNHSIMASDRRENRPRPGSDFLRRYVFPHSEIPYVSDAVRAMGQQDLEVVDLESWRNHYARTLQCWTARLEASRERAEALVGRRRYRIWRIYLAGCALAFERGWVSVHQKLACKRSVEGALPLPGSRAHLYEPARPGEVAVS